MTDEARIVDPLDWDVVELGEVDLETGLVETTRVGSVREIYGEPMGIDEARMMDDGCTK